MLKLFLRVFLAFLAVIGIFLLIGSLLPRNYSVESSVIIETPIELAFPHINELRNWEHWSPISVSRIENLTVDFSGANAGVGAIQTWTESRGTGKMWIEKSEANQLIEYKWRFVNFPELTGQFIFERVPNPNYSIDAANAADKVVEDPANSGHSAADADKLTGQPREFCKVTWTSTGRLPSGPFYGYLAFVFEGAMRSEYSACLERLKNIVQDSLSASR
ncbi:MAG TPA: SRPBCC family protein [Pirellulaceae bacterium]|nr:SRPBCC family protein [Pirellulaceae bacterium]HMO92059.1 SRPBCC family protein [Pirellulaceae bacterium]HMP69935.1 SRPBCC family protein [Pirellulaceae bacterium]